MHTATPYFILAPVAVVAAMVVTPTPADACNHAPQTGDAKLIAPVDGATDVPINTVVSTFWGEWSEDSGATSSLSLRPVGGPSVLVETARTPWFYGSMSERHRPLESLLPNTTYEVFEPVGPVNNTERTIGTFTTGSTMDTLEPGEPETLGVAKEPAEKCAHDWCCVPDVMDVQRITITSSGNASEQVLYDVYQGATVVVVDATMPLHAFAQCSDYSAGYENRYLQERIPWRLQTGEQTLTLVPHDTAGNEAPAVDITLTMDCMPEGDGPFHDAGQGEPDETGNGGCSIGLFGNSRNSASSAILLFVVLLASGRRRRQP